MQFSSDLIGAFRSARRITALTGAGISAESGVPTFREAQTGLWAKYDPTELATSDAFRRNPKLVWEWYEWRRDLVAKARPNPGHMALARMANHVHNFTLITQNVDGLHQRAGSESVIELHGNIHRAKCVREDTVVETWKNDGQIPPRCPRCGDYLRPDVVWFGEAMPYSEWRAASEAAWRCDLFLCLGTSALVQPAASLPFRALERGAVVIEVNPDDTPLTPHVTHALRGKAGEVLPELVDALRLSLDRS